MFGEDSSRCLAGTFGEQGKTVLQGGSSHLPPFFPLAWGRCRSSAEQADRTCFTGSVDQKSFCLAKVNVDIHPTAADHREKRAFRCRLWGARVPLSRMFFLLAGAGE